MSSAKILQTSCLVLIVGIWLSSAFVAQAQIIQPGDFKGDITLTGDHARQIIAAEDSEDLTLRSTVLQQQISARSQHGAFLSPRLLTFSLGANIGINQRFQESSNGAANGLLWGYDVGASLLPNKGVSLNVLVNRNQYFLARELTGLSLVQVINNRYQLNLRRLYIPSIFTYYKEEWLDELIVGRGGGTQRDDLRNRMTYEGQRGWTDSQLSVNYEYIDHTDNLYEDRSYRSHLADALFSIDMGTELNWRWDSIYQGSRRTAYDSLLTTSDLKEQLQGVHSPRFRTTYLYEFSRVQIYDSETTTHQGTFSLSHQLYESLVSSFSGTATYLQLSEGQKQTLGGTSGVIYTKRLPLNGRLIIRLSGGMLYQDEGYLEGQSVAVVESHTADSPVANPILLDNLNVIESTIEVTKTGAGELPVGCVPTSLPTTLTEGIDFNVRTRTTATEIEPLGCSETSVGINPGDTIEVYYVFTVSSLTLLTTSMATEVGLGFGWFRAYVKHEASREDVIEGGSEDLLENPGLDSAGLEADYKGKSLEFKVIGEAYRRSSNYISYRGFSGRQQARTRINRTLSLDFNSSQEVTWYDEPPIQTMALSGRFGAVYVVSEGVLLDGYSRLAWIRDTTQIEETTIEATMRVRWSFRRVELNSSLTYVSRRRADAGPRELRYLIQVIRSFS